ncbi:hypothetical protein LUX57_08570 [Actinomadura madurae]|nr:hypothetical protein [Actinomadura madurae]MCP9965183.1 hypothetical protein [Actinomadura madurae]
MRTMRIAAPICWVVRWTAAIRVPVTVSSVHTVTLEVAGSTAHPVPGMSATDRWRVLVTRFSVAGLRCAILGTAPADRTAAASVALVTVTTGRPAEST